MNSEEFLTRCDDAVNARRFPAWTSVDIGGVQVIVDADEPEFGSFIAEHAHWEPHIVDLISDLLSEGSVFVDIGANVGIMSFHAARKIGSSGKVIGFEPKPENVQAYLRGMQANGFRNVMLYPFGASNTAAVFALKGGSNAFLAQRDEGSVWAQCLPADDLLDREPRIDLIKIDIEGHEPYALEGLHRTIERHHPQILCEFNPRCLNDHIGREPSAFASTLFRLAREIVVIHHDGVQSFRFPVSCAQELLDLWADHNAQAVSSGRLPDGLLHFDLLLST